jgi:hypothetical protein
MDSDLPTKEPIRIPFDQDKRTPSYWSEGERFLGSRVGERFDQIYSDIVHRSKYGPHKEMYKYLIEYKDRFLGWHFFVEDGILKEKKRKKYVPIRVRKFKVVRMGGLEFVKSGCWYSVKFKEFNHYEVKFLWKKFLRYHDEYDCLLKRNISYGESINYYDKHHYVCEKIQCGKRTCKKLEKIVNETN